MGRTLMCTCSGCRTARTPTRRTRKLFWRTLWESNFHPSERPPSLKVQYPVPIIIHAKASLTWRWFCFSVFPKTKSTLTSQTESICEGECLSGIPSWTADLIVTSKLTNMNKKTLTASSRDVYIVLTHTM